MTLNEDTIKQRIKKVRYEIVDLEEGPRLTLCFITMRGGFVVTGQSACINTEDFNRVFGERYAFENGFEKLWELEGYRIKEGSA